MANLDEKIRKFNEPITAPINTELGQFLITYLLIFSGFMLFFNTYHRAEFDVFPATHILLSVVICIPATFAVRYIFRYLYDVL